MIENKKFNYNSIEEFMEAVRDMELELPFSEDISILKEPLVINNKKILNRLGINPMEGCDGTLGGKPDELTIRRYERFASGGAGLMWVEASAVVNEGRANPNQLFISRENQIAFTMLVNNINEASRKEYGDSFASYNVIQLTHSGRYSRTDNNPIPMIAVSNPYLDKFLPSKYTIISDTELEILENAYVQAAVIARECGFDAVDIKSCHGYLNSELLSSFTREGRYGGSFENRTRFLLNIIDKINGLPGKKIDITLRINVYDAIPYPYGWGVDKKDFRKPDLTEPIKLIEILQAKGIKLINLTCGNPYYNPHVGRPYDTGSYIPPNHPLVGVAKMLNIIKEIQQSVPEMLVVATGFSWFREYAPFIAAGGIKEGWFKIAGFGRQAFAYPDFARDILKEGKMDRKKCCIACSKCSEIMRDRGKTGCVIRDNSVYGSIYKAGRQGKVSLIGSHEAEHI